MSHVAEPGRRTFIRRVVGLPALILFGRPGSRLSADDSALLRDFIQTPDWQVDITWNAEETFENADVSANLRLTATASFVVKRRDQKATVGRWEAQKATSSNIAYKSAFVRKRAGERVDFEGTGGPLLLAVAVFLVEAPGRHRISCQAAYPVKTTVTPAQGFMPPSLLTVATSQGTGATPGVGLDGPLPGTGKTVHGSGVIPFPLGPFGSPPVPAAKLGIQYVVRPWVDPLAPLVKPTRK